MRPLPRPSKGLGCVLVHQHNGRHDVLLVGLDNAAVHDHFVKHEVDGLEILHDVQLTHVLEVAVERLDEGVDWYSHVQLTHMSSAGSSGSTIALVLTCPAHTYVQWRGDRSRRGGLAPIARSSAVLICGGRFRDPRNKFLWPPRTTAGSRPQHLRARGVRGGSGPSLPMRRRAELSSRQG